ncbi:MAG: hypothetical protein IT191_03385 [Microbacteriaceae bacterium]|nr:hypothetical protein [Cryobacterium sp.]MBX3103556.1 hypothetical protein [Cryobacterium sp.]MCC6376039.1 hypothetical protein [Microbacteriaceae bacterium]
MTQATTQPTATIEQPEFKLGISDRCDSCGAQAYIRAVIGESELLFCAHHGRHHQEKLSKIATSWHDESSRLDSGN